MHTLPIKGAWCAFIQPGQQGGAHLLRIDEPHIEMVLEMTWHRKQEVPIDPHIVAISNEGFEFESCIFGQGDNQAKFME